METNSFKRKNLKFLLIPLICMIIGITWLYLSTENPNLRKVVLQDNYDLITISKKNKIGFKKGIIIIGDSVWISELSYNKKNTKIKLGDLHLPYLLSKKAGSKEIEIITKKDTLIFVLKNINTE